MAKKFPPFGESECSLLRVCYVVLTVNATTGSYEAKLSRYTPWLRLGERRYSFHSFLTSAQDRGEWSASRPGRALPPGKGPPVPIVQEAGWAPEPVWTQRLEEKSFATAGDRTLIAQSLRYGLNS
jgi:hypothetical protein